ncbi:MAG: peptide chain release factor N(5)-glutamine methyltransferase [Oscillospiraceae bacterium]
MVIVRQLIKEQKQKLCHVEMFNKNEIATLFETAFGCRYETCLNDEADEDCAARFESLVSRRIGGEPLQYIRGRWPFCDFELAVGEGVLIPRPETEEVAQYAACVLERGDAKGAVIDLCSGSGCIAIYLKRRLPQCSVTALELFAGAFSYLKKNTELLAPDIEIVRGDVFDYQQKIANGSLSMIVSNPPYVTAEEYGQNEEELCFEPTTAFLGGGDGLDFYRHIAKAYYPTLNDGGSLVFEIGCSQAEAVRGILTANGYRSTRIIKDSAGMQRIAHAVK